MSINRCPTCGEFIFPWNSPHKCNPAFECVDGCNIEGLPPDDGASDVTTVYAVDAESAAEKFAELADSNGDYTFANAGEGTVWVRPKSGGKWEKYNITAEQVVNYTAELDETESSHEA